jgi:hypothetical protein
VTSAVGNFPDVPHTISVLTHRDQSANWVAHIANHDIIEAKSTNGLYLLVSLDEDGVVTIATKPGSAWDARWSAPIKLERR